MPFNFLNSAQIKALIEKLTPRFVGRDQDHLLALADGAADAAYEGALDLIEPLQDFKADIESSAGAGLVGILDTAGNFTSDDVEGALAELATADGTFIPLSQKGAVNGVATLDSSGTVPSAQIPAIAITDTFTATSEAAMLALSAEKGDVAIRTDLNKSFILSATPASTPANWKELLTPTDSVTSVFGRTGVVTAQANDYTFAQLAARPTTLAGYGITDAPATGSEARFSAVQVGPDSDLRMYQSSEGALSFRVGGAGAYRYATFTADGDLYLLNGTVKVAGNDVWHPGNFTPSAKADLTGATFTGDLRTYRSSAPTTGVIYLGNDSGGARYLYYDGTNYVMPGAALWVNGAPVWTSATLDPTTKANIASPTFTGSIAITGVASGVAGIDVSTNAGRVLFRNTRSVNSIDSANSANTAYAPLNIEATTLTFQGSPVWYEGASSVALAVAGNEFNRAAANSTTQTRQPRIFVQAGDPGAAAADGDLWIW